MGAVLTTRDGDRLPTPDGWLDEVGLALQVHSREYHLRDEDWEVTVEGDTALGATGVPVLAVTPRSLRDDPDGFRRRVERVYAALRRSGRRPDVVMQPWGEENEVVTPDPSPRRLHRRGAPTTDRV